MALTRRSQVSCLGRYDLPTGGGFGLHVHPDHQLAWAATGVVSVVTPASVRVLPPTQAMWIPGGTEHDVIATRPAELYCLYLEPEDGPQGWDAPSVVAVSPLVRELLLHLSGQCGRTAAPLTAHLLLFELLQPLSTRSHRVPMPADSRALGVASGLLADPCDDRSLADWGRLVGASARTLARLFVAETGLTFMEWRIQARLHASLVPLAAGEPVMNVSNRVGYASTSAFVAAFRRQFGSTPAQYFAETA
jgi:AraC-like DNA-binding protein